MTIRVRDLDGFHKGQRVKLNQRGVKVYSRACAPGRKSFLDWSERTGTVVRMIGTRKDVMITWDGNSCHTLSALPISLLEKAAPTESIERNERAVECESTV